MQNKKAFTTKEISRILGIYPKTLSYWVTKGVLQPDVYSSGGKGTTRLFSPLNVYESLVIRTLSGENFPLDWIGDILSFLRGNKILQRIAIDPQYRSSPKHLLLARSLQKRAELIDILHLDGYGSYNDFKLLAMEFDTLTLINLRFLDEWVPTLLQAGVSIESE